MPPRLVKDSANQFQTVFARDKTEARLVAIFGRQRLELLARHIGRIADNNVIRPAVQRFEKIGAHGRDTIFDPKLSDIVLRQIQRIL